MIAIDILRHGVVFELVVGVAQVCQRHRHLEKILAIMPLVNLECALQEPFLLCRVIENAVGVAQVCQRVRNLKMVLARFQYKLHGVE